jgi:hypothetical protein
MIFNNTLKPHRLYASHLSKSLTKSVELPFFSVASDILATLPPLVYGYQFAKIVAQ